ncbi:DUF2316 family protein [Macrococcus brunensis]|uniref:DUF2316 family protein n=1 Tax=Macrococcus brunensis TaxID=198483 RepID=A0A4R6BEH3_9STAP|nr:DUF2316 family protein [Macrococcus brunensis]TDL98103.1 DUF2316 family protein [Macrococcus brunensis]
MSLNKEQRAVTSQELKSHFEASSFTLESPSLNLYTWRKWHR